MDEPTGTKLIMSDHDLLITLNTKFDQLSIDVKSMSDGITQQLANHELRIRAEEKLHDELKPFEVAKETRNNSQWIHDFDTRSRLLLTLVIFFSAAISFVATLIYQSLHIFK